MNLPSQHTLVQRAEAIWDHVAAFAGAHWDDPLVWCNMPRFGSMVHARMSQPHRVPSELSASEARRLRQGQTARRQRLAPGVTGALVGRGCVFMADGANQYRSQAPLHERFGPVQPGDRDMGASYWRARRLSRRAVSGARELVHYLRANEVVFPIDSADICMRFLRTFRLIGYWEQLMTRERPAVAVVGSITAPRARTLIHVARRAGVPTVYVPHSPQSTVNVRLAGLPVDYAGLRGAGEADYLAGHGADGKRLDLVGNPTIAPEPVPRIDPTMAPAFAAGLEEPFRVGPLVDVIREALGGDVTVGRHPKADAEGTSRVFPPEWRVFEGRTYELLRAGPPMVVQHSSGVALEALHLGIPVIELSYPGKPALYPFAREPYVRFASDSRQLAAAAASAADDAADRSRREALVGWAHRWSSPNGDEAAERVVALVERARTQGPRGAIWDPMDGGARLAASGR